MNIYRKLFLYTVLPSNMGVNVFSIPHIFLNQTNDSLSPIDGHEGYSHFLKENEQLMHLMTHLWLHTHRGFTATQMRPNMCGAWAGIGTLEIGKKTASQANGKVGETNQNQTC